VSGLVKKEILAFLQKQILPLQSFKLAATGEMNIHWGGIEAAFPNQRFPLGAVHEFVQTKSNGLAATCGFVSCLLSGLMKKNGICFWIHSSSKIFPPALKFFDIEPDQIIFIKLRNEKEILWVIEEALKCEGLAALVAEINDVSFKESRRFQLAVEKSRVTGFLIRNREKVNTIASVSRWRISHLPSEMNDDLPGVGFPRWQVSLEKMRNGRVGHWDVEWKDGQFIQIMTVEELLQKEGRRKTG
jgi:protein ImuA